MNDFLYRLRTHLVAWRGTHSIQISKEAFMRMSLIEKALASLFSIILILSSLVLLHTMYLALSEETPTYGGELHEGIIGAPRFINPLLTMTSSDQDLTALVYSGLLKTNKEGELEPDLALSLPTIIDAKTYEISIHPHARFHDGTPVTADDVVYTAQKIQNPLIRSPFQGDWSGVEVEKIDTYTVRFKLSQAHSPFIYNLTIGILPKHVWQSVSDEQFAFSEHNITPIGSGPYQISSIDRKRDGTPATYTLTSFENYLHNQPYITTLSLHIYATSEEIEKALKEGRISSGVIDKNIDMSDDFTQYLFPMKRVFAVFFNQNESPVLREKAVRQALIDTIPREYIINETLNGYGIAINDPLPSLFWDNKIHKVGTSPRSAQEVISELEENGWQKNEDSGIMEKKIGSSVEPLSISLHTGNIPALDTAAEILKETWKQIGVDVVVNKQDVASLISNVVRPRSYEALLFGQIVSHDNDLFAYWHSKERNDPGLNVSLFTNRTADQLLEDIGKTTTDKERHSLYEQFNTLIKEESPAGFIYVPVAQYIVSKNVHGVETFPIVYAKDRFYGIESWYTETKRNWIAFTD